MTALLKQTHPYLYLDREFFQRIKPTPLNNTKLMDISEDLCKLINLDPQVDDVGAFINTLLEEPYNSFAMCYAGHQFGFYAPRLGDGRAINISMVNQIQLQLKGAGQTRYSRDGDGRAVLRSSVREYLMSEAMFHLGIPTTRALALLSSDELVQREQMERAAIVVRASKSWIRFGHLEYFYYKRKYDKLKTLLDYIIQESYPQLQKSKDAYEKLFASICETTAKLIAHWQAVGFTHGVMNTDNMSIKGLTIDYGPFGFLERYDSNYICNHSDDEGRYSFGNQPYIAQWNLSKLMQTFTPFVDQNKLETIYENYREMYLNNYTKLMSAKLGLMTSQKEDRQLIRSLLKLLQAQSVDYTNFFRTLSHFDSDITIFCSLFSDLEALESWLQSYQSRLQKESSSQADRQQQMLQTNPKYILRNALLQEAIEGLEVGDQSSFKNLKTLLQNPYDEHPGLDYYAKPLGLGMENIALSCSS
jgi:uncharacterized protein YdiU (UPF0061 family)